VTTGNATLDGVTEPTLHEVQTELARMKSRVLRIAHRREGGGALCGRRQVGHASIRSAAKALARCS